MEIWKDIKGYEGLYQVSNCGRIKSFHKKENGAIIKVAVKRGYYQAGLRKNGLRKFYQVHRLVAQAFIENKDNLPQVNHIDENKLNNNVENLEWCTVSYNNCYGTRLKRVYENNKSRKPVVFYDLKNNIVKEFSSIMEAHRITKIPTSCIVHSCKNKDIKPRKYIWRYKSEVMQNV